MAIRILEKESKKRGLTNIRPLLSDCRTGLAPQSVDVVLLYDTLHDVEDKPAVLTELQRVLKPAGRISYRDHTLRGEPLLDLMKANGFFPVEQELRSAFQAAGVIYLSSCSSMFHNCSR